MPSRFIQSCHVLAVPDVEASQRHYVEALGFEPLDIDAPGWRFVQRGPARFDLGECPDALPPAELGDHSYVARIFMDDLDAYHAEIAPRGANITSGPHDQLWGLREMGVRTIDGHRITFCQVIEP